MKIGIVTVYQSYNCGSFLQAYALHKVLAEGGHDVGFIKNKFTLKARLWFRLLQAVQYTLTGKVKRARHVLKIYKNFKNARKQQRVFSSFKGVDAVIYGSDTIWNTEEEYFLKHWRRFFGDDYNGTKIAYAASVGPTSPEKLLQNANFCKALSKFQAVGVRDAQTKVLIDGCGNQAIEGADVIDPTMLLLDQDYAQITPDVGKYGYILFYYFGTIPKSVKEQVRAFADKTNRKIVVFGEDRGWADIYVANDPFLMLGYYKNADYVVTNTFHGNIFSIIFNRQFISFGKDKQKVCDLLAQFGLPDRLVDTDADLTQLFEQTVDFTAANEKREELRQTSLEFLDQQIIKAKDA